MKLRQMYCVIKYRDNIEIDIQSSSNLVINRGSNAIIVIRIISE